MGGPDSKAIYAAHELKTVNLHACLIEVFLEMK